MLISDDKKENGIEPHNRVSRLPDFADSLGKTFAEALQQSENTQGDCERILRPFRDTLIVFAQSQSGRRAAVLGEAVARMGRRSLDCVRDLQGARGEEIVAKLMLQLCDEVFLAAPTLPDTNPIEAKMAYCMTCNILRKFFKSRQASGTDRESHTESSTSHTSTDQACVATGNSRSITSSPSTTPRPSSEEAKRCALVLCGLGQLLPAPIFHNLSAEVFSQLAVIQPYVSTRGVPSAEEQAIASWLAQNAECEFTLKAAAARVIRLAQQQVQERSKIADAVRVAMSSTSSEIAEVEKMVVPDHAVLRRLESTHGPLHVTLMNPNEPLHVSTWAAVTIPSFAKEMVKLGGKLEAVDTFIEALSMKVVSQGSPVSMVFVLDALADIIYDALQDHCVSITPQTRGRIKQQVRAIFKTSSNELRDQEVDRVGKWLLAQMRIIGTWRTPAFERDAQDEVARSVCACLARTLADATVEYADCDSDRISALHREMLALLEGNRMANQSAQSLLDRVLAEVSSSSAATTFLLKLAKRVARLVDEEESRPRFQDAINLGAPEKKTMAFVEDLLTTLTENVLRQFTSVSRSVLSQFAKELGHLVAPTVNTPSAPSICSQQASWPGDWNTLSEDLRARCTRLGDWLGEELLRSMKERTDTISHAAGHVCDTLHEQPVSDIRAMVQLILWTAIRNITRPGLSGRLAQRDLAHAEDMLTSFLDHFYFSLVKNGHFSLEDKDRLQLAILEVKPLIRQGLNEKRYLSRVSEWSELPPASVRSTTPPETTHPRQFDIGRGSKRSDVTATAGNRLSDAFSGAQCTDDTRTTAPMRLKKSFSRRRNFDIDSLLDKDASFDEDSRKRTDKDVTADFTRSASREEFSATTERARRATRCLDKMAALVDDALGKESSANNPLRKLNNHLACAQPRDSLLRRITAQGDPQRKASESVIIGEWMVDIWKQAISDAEKVDLPPTNDCTESLEETLVSIATEKAVELAVHRSGANPDKIRSSVADVMKDVKDSFLDSLVTEPGAQRETMTQSEQRTAKDSIRTEKLWSSLAEMEDTNKLALPFQARSECDIGRDEAGVGKSGDEISMNDVMASGEKRLEEELRTITASFMDKANGPGSERRSSETPRRVSTPLTNRRSTVENVQCPIAPEPFRLHLPSVTESFGGRFVSCPRVATARECTPRGKPDTSPCTRSLPVEPQGQPVEKSRVPPGDGAYLLFHQETRNFELHWCDAQPPMECIFTLLGYFVGTKNVPACTSTMENGIVLCRRDMTDRRNVFNAWAAFLTHAVAHGASQVNLFVLEGPSVLHFATKLCFKNRRTQQIRIQRAGEESRIDFVGANGHTPSVIVALHPNNLIFDGVYTLEDNFFVEEGKTCGAVVVISKE